MFWKFHELLYKKQPADPSFEKKDVFTESFLTDVLREIASEQETGKVINAFQKNLSKEALDKDMGIAGDLGVNSTPSVFINGVKFPKPDLDPYNLIKNTFLKANKRLEASKGHKPIIRAYLQDFTATWIGKGNWQYYEDEQVRQQIKGLYDAGCEEWFLWDPQNKYREGAFEKQ